MKSYYLRLTQANFTLSGNSFVSNTIDLYYNTQYKNYSVKKSSNGTNLLGNGVYTGINKRSATSSEIGFVENGRFIDTSGQIDIVDWHLNYTSNVNVSADAVLTTHTSADSTAIQTRLDEWSSTDSILGSPIYSVNAGRYAFFSLQITSLLALASLQFELYILIEIDPPVVNGYFSGTKRLQNKFPEWMALREYDPADALGVTAATPTTVGGSLLNALAGEYITDVAAKTQYQQYQLYIDSVDLTQKAWVYKVTGVPAMIYSITGDGVALSRTSDIGEYHETLSTEDVCFWNIVTNEIYTNKKYTTFQVNGVTYQQSDYQVWNSLDDIGAGLDLFRMPLESNVTFKQRIVDIYRNPSGVNLEAFKLGLRRELNLWKYYGSTPDSDFHGATPIVSEIADLEKNSLYFQPNGIPTEKFIQLVSDLAKKYPMTWGHFLWDQAFWDADGVRHDGFSTLPRQLDATPVTVANRESGVGDGNDLYLFKPQAYTGLANFTSKLKIRGRKKTTRTEYSPVKFTVKVYGTAAESAYTNPPVSGNFTIELSNGGLAYYCNVTATTQNNITFFSTPNSSSIADIDWTTPDGYTDVAFVFRNKADDVVYPVSQLPLISFNKVEIKKGWYGGPSATPSYTLTPNDANYRLWFASTPGTWIGAGSAASSLIINSFNYLTNTPKLNFQSQSFSYFQATPNMTIAATPNAWVSDTYTYDIYLNGALPNKDPQNYVLQLPNIVWPTSTTSRQYVIELATFNGAEYGAYMDSTSATPGFINSSYLRMNNSNTWLIGGKAQTVPFNTTSVTFSTGTGTAYPITTNVWSLFEADQVSQIQSGSVDQNGPVINGVRAPRFNQNFLLTRLNLTRDDFGIPNTTDYIVTWIGIGSNTNNNVLVWTDSNAVIPAITDPGETALNATYPDNAVVEAFNTGTSKYGFSSLNLYAKYKPGVNAQWNPKIHSGYFYDDIDEYYLYADPAVESATVASFTLSGINRQGAPIMVKAMNAGATPIVELRQTAFFDIPATPYATPITPSLVNKELVNGNGTKSLRVGHRDIYNISVLNVSLNQSVAITSTTAARNVISLVSNSIVDHQYLITYTPRYSYYVDNSATDPTTGAPRSKLVFDQAPAAISAASYQISYENSTFNPATPVDIPLNTFYTSFDEGFVFIDHDIRPLSQLEIKVSPTTMVADGIDYALVTFRSYDDIGNPKPFQKFNIFTNFGSFDKSSVTTDRDGFGSAVLQSKVWTGGGIQQATPATPSLTPATPGTTNQGLIAASGTISAVAGFDIQLLRSLKGRVIAAMDSDSIIANGTSATAVFGLVENASHVPMAGVKVFWNKGRTIYDLFKNRVLNNSSATPGSLGLSGSVTTDNKGRFTISPFISSNTPGYWFVSAEATIAATPSGSDLRGDVVYWYEYPNVTSSIDTVSGLPLATVQSATPAWTIPQYTYGSSFPVSWDEAKQLPATPNTIVWTPPSWYAIDKYKQYQMGLNGKAPNVPAATPSYPDYKEL